MPVFYKAAGNEAAMARVSLLQGSKKGTAYGGV
jgi:hypothetical protein